MEESAKTLKMVEITDVSASKTAFLASMGDYKAS
jgi:hypothetical protein